jgi:hypothetical protein
VPGVAAQRRGTTHPQETVDAAFVDGGEECFIVMAEEEVGAVSKLVLELGEVLKNLAGLWTAVDVVAKEYERCRVGSCSFYDLGQGVQNAVDVPEECDLAVHSVTRGSSS